MHFKNNIATPPLRLATRRPCFSPNTNPHSAELGVPTVGYGVDDSSYVVLQRVGRRFSCWTLPARRVNQRQPAHRRIGRWTRIERWRPHRPCAQLNRARTGGEQRERESEIWLKEKIEATHPRRPRSAPAKLFLDLLRREALPLFRRLHRRRSISLGARSRLCRRRCASLCSSSFRPPWLNQTLEHNDFVGEQRLPKAHYRRRFV